MRPIRLIFLLSILTCSPEHPAEIRHNRFIETLNSAAQIGDLTVLTDDNRTIYPMFAVGDSIMYFRRLLVADAADTTGRNPEELIKPFGIRISDKQLYTLSEDYHYPEKAGIPTQGLPTRYGETIVWAVESPDGKTVAYETIVGRLQNSRIVYLARGDSTVQLTYGDIPCFIDRFSNTGRYLTVICGYGPSWIIIFDMEKNIGYKIDRDGDSVDYMTLFSSDDKSMVFIRSQKKYSYEYDFFGDICLFKFR